MTPAGKTVYPVKAINVLKAHGKSARESALLKGYALNLGRASQGMPKAVTGARVACLDMNLQRARMHMGIQARCSMIDVIAVACISRGLRAWPEGACVTVVRQKPATACSCLVIAMCPLVTLQICMATVKSYPWLQEIAVAVVHRCRCQKGPLHALSPSAQANSTRAGSASPLRPANAVPSPP